MAKAPVRPVLGEGGDALAKHAAEAPLAADEGVIEALALHAAQEAHTALGLPNLLCLAITSAYLFGLLPVGGALAILVRHDAQQRAAPTAATGPGLCQVNAHLSRGRPGH